MCLDKKMSLEERKEITSLIGRKGIIVYKVVGFNGKKCYYPPAKNTTIPYKDGLNEAIAEHVPTNIDITNYYWAGFHFFAKKRAAIQYLEYLEDLVENHYKEVSQSSKIDKEIFYKKYKVIKCIIKKSWVMMVGKQVAGTNGRLQTVIVSKKAIFPEFKEVAV